MNIFPKKAKLTEQKLVPNDMKEQLPEKGFAIFYRAHYSFSGKIIVNFEKKELQFDMQFRSRKKEGKRMLTENEFTTIIALANVMWASNNDFQGPLPARVIITDVVLTDKKQFRYFTFPGIFEGEMNTVHEFLLEIIQAND